LLSARVLVKIVAKSEPLALQYSSYIFVALILSHIIYALPTWGEHLTRQLYKNALMLFLNGLESFLFATQITPLQNYLKRQMLNVLGLHRDQKSVFVIFYQILSTVVLWS